MADDDIIYPTHLLDNDKNIKAAVISLTLRFSDVLDADRLHAALCLLLDTGDWRCLGGRLRSNKTASLEIHVPTSFTPQRPAVTYTHDVFRVPIAQHSLAKDLPPLSGDTPSLQLSGEHFRAFAAPPDAPSTLDAFVGRDVPMLSLHITTFEDATLVAICWPHIIMDAMGVTELLRGWSLALGGRCEQIPVVLDAFHDVLYEAADPSSPVDEPWVLQDQCLTGFALVLFFVRFLWAVLWEPKVESRGLFLPKQAIDALRARAKADIAHDTAAWVSEGDVLFAWACKLVSQAQSSPRVLNALNVLNTRSRLPETIRADGIFIHNMAIVSYIPVSKEEALGPLGALAFKYRRALTLQASAPQVRGWLRAVRQAWDSGKQSTIFCGLSSGELFGMTSWAKAGYLDAVDFAPAVVSRDIDGNESVAHTPGRMVYYHSQVMRRNALARNIMGVVGKDQRGNVWLQGYFPARTWAMIEEELERMKEL